MNQYVYCKYIVMMAMNLNHITIHSFVYQIFIEHL